MRLYTLPTLFLLIQLSVHAQRVEANLIDEFERYNCEDFIGRLDFFLAELSKSTDLRGAIIMYEGKYPKDGDVESELVRPVFGEIQGRVELFRSHVKNRGVNIKKIAFISGGFRENHWVELWLVPPGASFPVPKPTLRSMRYRKGRPTSIFPSCP